MSAPTAVDGGALDKGIAWHVDPPPLAGTTATVPVQHERRTTTSSVAQLSRTYNELCTQAVDPFEIAAGLEAAGVNDRIARLVYGSASVFDLADTLFAMVPRRPADIGMATDRWYRPLRVHLMRGLLYGLPGLLYAAAASSSLRSGPGIVLLLCATLAACGAVQGISVVGTMLVGWGENRAATTLFRGALAVGAIAAVALIAMGWLAPSMRAAAVLAGLQLEYMVAATVLLVLHAERRLLLVLAPGVVLSAAMIAGLADGPARVPVLLLLGLSPVAAVWAAMRQIATHETGLGRTLREAALRSGTIRDIGTVYVLYGIANAGLVSFAVVDLISRGSGTFGGPIVLMMLPLVASLGVAEWLVHRLRSRGALVLHETVSADAFRSRAVTTLLHTVLGYGALLAALVAVVVTVYELPGTAGRIFVLSTVSYAVLGLAFLLETLLLSLGRHVLALGLAVGALAVDTSLRWGLAAHPPLTVETAHLVVFVGLLLLLIPSTAAQYQSVGMHR